MCLLIGTSVSCSLTQKRIVRITPEQKATLDYLEQNSIELADIKTSMGGNNYNECSSTCCEEIQFCGISEDDVKKYMTNYRDNNWFHTSPFFTAKDVDQQDVSSVVQRITNGTYTDESNQLVDPTSDITNFDSRYMDVPISQLENYLCHIKNNPYTSEANTCRFYFLRYDNSMGIYSNKTTLALTPVQVKLNQNQYVTVKEYTEAYDSPGGITTAIFAIGECDNSPSSNHNHLCPPMNNCTKGTLIEEVDSGQ